MAKEEFVSTLLLDGLSNGLDTGMTPVPGPLNVLEVLAAAALM